MTSATFDFAPLLPAGLARAGGEVDGACEIQFCRRQQRSRPGPGRGPDRRRQRRAPARGQDARHLRACQRPAGLPPVARIPHQETQARRRHRLRRRRHPDRLRLAAGARPRQRDAARPRRYRDHRARHLSGRAEPADAARASMRSAFRSTRTACGWTRWPRRSPTSSGAASRRNTSTPSRPCRTRPAPSCPRRAAPNSSSSPQQYGVPIFEDDCYADLIWDGKRPPALYAMSRNGGVIHIGSFSKSIAPALRVGFIVAPWAMLSRMLALKTDAGSGALEQMVLAEYCAPHFADPCAEADARPARQARHADGGAQRAIRHLGRIRRPQGRHLPVGQAAGQCRYAEALPGRACRRRRHQSGAGMVDRQGLCRQPVAAVFCKPLARADPRRRRRARRSMPQGIRRAGADRQCGEPRARS